MIEYALREHWWALWWLVVLGMLTLDSIAARIMRGRIGR